MSKEKNIMISNRVIGENKPCFIIAEAGVNHNGSLRIARKLIDKAKLAGADAIKFQTYKTGNLVAKGAPKAEYQVKSTDNNSQFEMLKKLELSPKAFKILYNYCKRKEIIFLSTPFDPESAEFLNKLEIPAFKISSGEITNIPLLNQIGSYKKPIILSTGMATLDEVKEAVKVICSTGNKKIVLLHCTSNYPTRYDDVNLRAMDTLKNNLKLPVGYSDHTEGIEVSIAAVARGASIIEKHFTLDKTFPGPDHKASIDPEELQLLVKSIRNIEKSLGDGIKKPRKTEKNIMKVVRKSIVASKNISRGEKLTFEMLSIKRPGTGIKPKNIDKVLGCRTKRKINKNEVIKQNYLS